MYFLFIGYYDAEKMDQSSQEELDTVMERYNRPLEQFFKLTRVVQEWHPGADMKRASLSGGQIERQDGPDRHNSEQIGLRKRNSTAGGWKSDRCWMSRLRHDKGVT